MTNTLANCTVDTTTKVATQVIPSVILSGAEKGFLSILIVINFFALLFFLAYKYIPTVKEFFDDCSGFEEAMIILLGLYDIANMIYWAYQFVLWFL